MILRFLRDETGLSTVEYGIFAVFLGVWTLIALDAAGALPPAPR